MSTTCCSCQHDTTIRQGSGTHQELSVRIVISFVPDHIPIGIKFNPPIVSRKASIADGDKVTISGSYHLLEYVIIDVAQYFLPYQLTIGSIFCDQPILH